MSSALTTKARIKDRLQITVISFDDMLDRLILAVSSRIETMCNRTFMQAEYENELYDGSDLYGSYRTNLVIKNAPIVSLSSIEYKAGRNSDPDWTAFDEDEYDIDYQTGIVYFWRPMPRGVRNIRVSYTGGYSGFTIGVDNSWVFDITPDGDVDGSNRTYTLPANAIDLIVYADGSRVKSSNIDFTIGTDEFTLAVGSEAYSSISVDYKPGTEEEDDEENTLPADLVEVCESAVVKIFKRRDSDGRVSESLGESSTTWTDTIFTKEQLATIKNYRRGSFV